MENIPLWLYTPYSILGGSTLAVLAYTIHAAYRKAIVSGNRVRLEWLIESYRRKYILAHTSYQSDQTFRNKARATNYGYISLVYAIILRETYK